MSADMQPAVMADSDMRTDGQPAARLDFDTSADTRPAVVFDFDNTLYAGDSGQYFVAWLLRRNRWRMALAALAAPVCAPMIAWLPTRRRGVSAFVWIATLGRGRSGGLDGWIERYLDSHADALRARLLPAALAALREHLEAGERVIIATGAPARLARGILALAGQGGLPLLGTELAPWLGGMTVARHCHNQQKLRMLHESGCTVIAAAYSDSTADLPLLTAARSPVVVNPKPAAIPRFRRALPAHVRLLDWRQGR